MLRFTVLKSKSKEIIQKGKYRDGKLAGRGGEAAGWRWWVLRLTERAGSQAVTSARGRHLRELASRGLVSVLRLCG